MGAHAVCGVGSAIVETVRMGGRCGRSAAIWVLPIHPLASRPAGAWVLMMSVGGCSAIVEAVGMGGRWFMGVEDDTGRNRWPLVLYKAFPAAMGRSPL